MSDPLRSLADAARAVTAAATDEDVLEIVAQAARDVIGALSSLLTASARARDGGGVMALVLAQGAPPSIFRFRGVDRLLSLYPSREEAPAALSP